mgnify:CR=1 FL=1
MNKENTHPYQRIYLNVGLVGILVLALLGWEYYSSNRVIHAYTPLFVAIEHIKVEVTTAHLELEKTLGGDTHEKIEYVWQHLDLAELYVQAMLEGGKGIEDTIIPVADHGLRQDIQAFLDKLLVFRNVTEERFELHEGAVTGTDIDQRYDALFSEFRVLADGIEMKLKGFINQEVSTHRIIEWALVFITLVFFMQAMVFFHRHQRRQREYTRILEGEITERKQAEEERAVLALRNEALVKSFGEVVYDWRPLEDKLIWDGCFTQVLGYTPGEMGSNTESWTSSIHPEDLQRVLDEVERATQGHRPFVLEYRFKRKDGSYCWMLDWGETFVDGRGTLTRIIGAFSDITERKQAEEALNIQARIATIFSTITDEEMFNEVLKVILDVLHSPLGVFGYLDENGDWLAPAMTRQVWDKCLVPGKTIRFPRETWEDSTWARALREKRSIHSNEPFTNLPEGHVGIQRHISMPILFQGEAIGLFQVANKETDYTEADIRTLADIAGHVAPLLRARLQRDRIQKALQESERRFREMLENVELIAVMLDAEGRVTFCNDYLLRLTGRSRADVLGQNWFAMFVPPELHIEDAFRAGMEQGTIFHHFKNEILTTSGERRLVTWNNTVLRAAEGRVTGTASIGQDITRLKRAEEEREKLINELQDAFAKIKTLNDMLPICAYCKKIRDDDGYWNQLESYISAHTDTQFSHGICPECAEKAYAELEKIKKGKT